MQLRGAWRAAGRAIAQRRKIGVGEQRAREKSHIYRSGPAGEERDFVVRQRLHDLIRLVARNHHERAVHVDRHPGRVRETPDVEHRRDVEEHLAPVLAGPDVHVLEHAREQAAMGVVHALRDTGRAAREDHQREVVGARQRRAVERERCVVRPRVERDAARAQHERRADTELLRDVRGLLRRGLIADH